MNNTEYLDCLLVYTDSSLTMKDKGSGAGITLYISTKLLYPHQLIIKL